MPQYQGPEADRIKKMFGEIAHGYDKANSVMSMGIHHLWRKALVKWSGAKPGDSVLDCATGTGDLAFEFKRTVKYGRVVGTDFCKEMLESAPKKSEELELPVEFSVADVMDLPFADNEFDFATISFGIRNVNQPVKALSELARVVKPGGQVLILEFGQVDLPGVKELYNFYSQKVLPKIGGWVTGKPEAYQYLQKSSSHFPCREDFLDLMKQSGGYETCEFKSLSLGIAYIYKGTVKTQKQ